jgi:hypothetical protein
MKTKDREEEEIIQTHSSIVSFTVIYLQIFYLLLHMMFVN